ncbi:MAG: hypothetical protein Q7S31_01500 [bacterium]|nr:hypothetical protein [bacterium]
MSVDIYRLVDHYVHPSLRLLFVTTILAACGGFDKNGTRTPNETPGVVAGSELIGNGQDFSPESLAELVKNILPTSWDADKSLPGPEALSRQTMADWYAELNLLSESGQAAPEDIRT